MHSYTHTHTHTHIHTHTHTHTHMYIQSYIRIHSYTHSYMVYRTRKFCVTTPQHTNSTFARNQGSLGSADTTAVTAYRVLITFIGSTVFLENDGGGITLLSSRMEIQGTVMFENLYA